MRELPGAQQGDRWIKNRVGRITASRMGDVMNRLTKKSKNGEKGEPGGKYIGYRRELIGERMTHLAANHEVTPWMEMGSAKEDEARSVYELETGQMVLPVGFVLHPRLDWTGASADGLVGEDGTLEIKCPKRETLIEWLETEKVPDEYLWQAQWEIACCERQWCDFWGWYPGLPYFRVRIARVDSLIEEMEKAAEQLHLEVEAFLASKGYPPTTWDDSAGSPELAEVLPEDESMITQDDMEWLANR